MKKLRLLLWEDCNRKCEGCCNKEWNLDILKKTTNFLNYSEIILTGGEPMLYPEKVEAVVDKIRRQTDVPIYMYTAKTDNAWSLGLILDGIDGLTVTLHEQKDVSDLIGFNAYLNVYNIQKSLRLNVFKGVDIGSVNLSRWKVRDNIEWIKDCPLPKNEVFMAYGT